MADTDPDEQTGTGDLDLPEHLAPRPDNRHEYEFPTAWLLGTQLVTSLRDMAMSAIFEFDPRDWMTAGDKPIDLTDIEIANDTSAEGEWDKACWIDFLADSGDSPRLVYQLAHLLQQPQLKVLTPRKPDATRDCQLAFDGRPRLLPRGGALIFGGDTAYPIATRRRLLERLRAPFVWAYQGIYPGAEKPARKVALLGIPGNHDYYNELYGFERVFHAGSQNPQLQPRDRVDLPGYEAKQQASYFAAQLPFKWQIWGLDVERTVLDDRQRDYFKKIATDSPTSNLIVVTSKPTFVYHALSEHEKDIAESFNRLSLPLSFENDGQLPAGQVRLDLSGDTHLYERYWGTEVKTEEIETTDGAGAGPRTYRPPEAWTEAEPAPQRGNETETQKITERRDNYASVVSGLGGAFHHPSQLRFGNSAPRKAWPKSKDSAAAVGKRLIRPRRVFQAGAVGVVGLVLGAWVFLMVWLAERRDEIPANILDLPFGLHSRGDLGTALAHLVMMTSIVLTIAVVIGLVAGAVWWGKRLAGPIERMERPKRRWGWCSIAWHLTHRPLPFMALRWIGASRRNAWGVIATAPAWLATIALSTLVIVALSHCTRLIKAADGFGALYVWIFVLCVGLFALGFGVAGKRFKLRKRNKIIQAAPERMPNDAPIEERYGAPHYVKAFMGRSAFGLLGLCVALLMLWTPYAWMRLALSEHHRLYALLFFAYPLVRAAVLGAHFLSASARVRHAGAVLAFLVVIAIYAGVPICVLSNAELAQTVSPWIGFPLMALFGAYMACLWMGWYFFVCLQFDAHGNEAGGAARIVAYAQFMRIKLTKDSAEVWTIAAEDPVIEPTEAGRWKRAWRYLFRVRDATERPPLARLVDHFIVKRT